MGVFLQNTFAVAANDDVWLHSTQHELKGIEKVLACLSGS